MRERPKSRFYAVLSVRITPACAGKTEHRLSWPCLSKDHPRMCGKDICLTFIQRSTLGSPPHVRERLIGATCHFVYIRITPACAGKTTVKASLSFATRDHPRMCGKDSNGSLYFRPFTPADIQNLFNFFARRLTSSASSNAR